MRGLWNHIRTTLLAGILVIVPLIITAIVLRALFNTVDGVFGPLVVQSLRRYYPDVPPYLPGIGIVTTIVIVYLAGLLAKNVFGRALLTRVDALFSRVPLVKSVYVGVKQITSAFTSSDQGSSFKQVVMVEFPFPGNWTVGFVTGSLRDAAGREQVSVFVPGALNPATGFAIVLPKEKAIVSPMSVEEGFKFVVSAGVVQPAALFPSSAEQKTRAST